METLSHLPSKVLGAAMQAIGRALQNPGATISAAGVTVADGSAEIFEAAQKLVEELRIEGMRVTCHRTHIEVLKEV